MNKQKIPSLVLGLSMFLALPYPVRIWNDTIVNEIVPSSTEVVSVALPTPLPVSIEIKSIKLATTIEYVGITTEGIMDTPKDIGNVGWYALGPAPGAIGSSVITGHYGWKNGKQSAFDNLSKLKIGNIVEIIDSTGTRTSFTVTLIKRYRPEDDATLIFSSNDGQAHLNLITCAGTWNRLSKSYSNRLVVFTTKT